MNRNELAKCVRVNAKRDTEKESRKINLPSEDIVKFYHHVPMG